MCLRVSLRIGGCALRGRRCFLFVFTSGQDGGGGGRNKLLIRKTGPSAGNVCGLYGRPESPHCRRVCTPHGLLGGGGWTRTERRTYVTIVSSFLQTKESQWEKPDCMMSEEERKIFHKLGWSEYKTAGTTTGGGGAETPGGKAEGAGGGDQAGGGGGGEPKTYWFNVYSKKSVWSMPKEVEEYLKVNQKRKKN